MRMPRVPVRWPPCPVFDISDPRLWLDEGFLATSRCGAALRPDNELIDFNP